MILFTGASGFLGKIAVPILQQHRRTAGLCRHNTLNGSLIPVDLTDHDALEAVLALVQPTVVIHSAACRDPDACERDPDYAMRLHAGTTSHMAEWCNQEDASLVYISTDYVFDGKNPPYREDAPPSPLSVYGRTKAAGESAAIEAKRHMVVRIPLQYGYSQPVDDSMVLKIVARLKTGGKCEIDNWQFRYPTLADDVAHALVGLLRINFNGIVHLRAPSKVTRFDMWQHIARVFGYNPELVIPMADAETHAAARPRDAALDTALFDSLNLHQFHDFPAGLELTMQKMEADGYDWRA